ncbi:hypothetical protein [Mycoplasmopsis sturni]|uniref:hypothetical protein n=1 Tax=Mycoplasmopsis sturni TaxID=39047 RepID=UPI00055D6A1E|nr:hypothetical protein [Mycoplasmopsis sturni]
MYWTTQDVKRDYIGEHAKDKSFYETADYPTFKSIMNQIIERNQKISDKTLYVLAWGCASYSELRWKIEQLAPDSEIKRFCWEQNKKYGYKFINAYIKNLPNFKLWKNENYQYYLQQQEQDKKITQEFESLLNGSYQFTEYPDDSNENSINETDPVIQYFDKLK